MKNKNLIGISGKIGSGKNSVATIIQGLNASLDRDIIIHNVQTNKPFSESSGYKQVAFANKLKEVVSVLLNCSREQLNNRNFKNSFLPEFNVTVREFLQKTGDGLSEYNPDIFVKALFADYKEEFISSGIGMFHDPRPSYRSLGFPKWIITDMRFPNEFEAVKDRNGITIRVNREYQNPLIPEISIPEHPSEISLDHITDWDYVIDNNGTIEELIKKVREILNKENII